MALAQSQTCPDNISFSSGTITHWSAYTGNNRFGNGPGAIKDFYDAGSNPPTGSIGLSIISEYNLSATGIQVLTSRTRDFFGGFATIPNINGYQYTNSVLLGSTNVSMGGGPGGGPQGGYIRGISYKIDVPVSESFEPYTMTYAYAMVLENGTHNSIEQPLFSATLTINDTIVQCASPKYYLPTSNDARDGGRGATIDTAAVRKAGFILSSQASPNPSVINPLQGPVRLKDVWTKDWREVTFDLSLYRGQQVTLTFEADNCVPGGHFAYAYVALRNNCAGLSISGPLVACTSTPATYAIPALAGASYQWTVPPGWTITSSADTSIIHVLPGTESGYLIAHEINGCANLVDTLLVSTSPPTQAGDVLGDTEVCAGINISPLHLSGSRGGVIQWVSSIDGSHWNAIPDSTLLYTSQNLSATTVYKALVQNGASCEIDTSLGATILVDQKSDAGKIDPGNINLCQGQNPVAVLTESGNTGQIVNWQFALDSLRWNDIDPAIHDSVYHSNPILQNTQFRTVVKNGACIADTSDYSTVQIYSASFPQAAFNPADTIICYGGVAALDATVTIGTSYSWNDYTALVGGGSGKISSLPTPIQAQASPKSTTNYILIVRNAGCPNLLQDTFHVQVYAPIVVDPGSDTSVVINQPLQLYATSSETGDQFSWSPATELDNAFIPNPVGLYDGEIEYIKYSVTATSAVGCTGSADITVRVFKTGPDIFVPNAFTPGRNMNAIFRPIPVGVSSLQYFRIFNRWGQLVFSTNRLGDGWDGSVGGKPQAEGSFVWMVRGTSYTGVSITKKGIMTLIR